MMVGVSSMPDGGRHRGLVEKRNRVARPLVSLTTKRELHRRVVVSRLVLKRRVAKWSWVFMTGANQKASRWLWIVFVALMIGAILMGA